MTNAFGTVALCGAVVALSACEPFASTRAYSGPDSVIATGLDRGFDSGVLRNGEAAIAYDPDGCQNWIIDDGVEGYSSPRFNPDTGLPVCDNRFPPGTVIRPYQTESAGIGDRVAGPGVRTVVRQ
jgi:hypothetical protein